MRTLEPTPEDCNELLMALMKTRSIAAENGTTDVLELIEPLTMNPKTVELISDFASGAKTIDKFTWLNVASLLRSCPTWDICLAPREVRMPTPEEVYNTLRG